MKLDTKITEAMLASSRNLHKASEVIFSRFSMTATGHEILKLIAADVSTTTNLAEKMDNSLAGITHKTKALEQSGFIGRRFDPDDKRIWHFKITESGTAALANVNAIYQQALEQLYVDFSNDQKQQVFEFLDRVQTHMALVVHSHRDEFIQRIDELISQHGDG